MDHARVLCIHDIDEQLVGKRVRFVGRWVAHNLEDMQQTDTIRLRDWDCESDGLLRGKKRLWVLLASRTHSIIVDIGLCFDPDASKSLELFAQRHIPVMVIGRIEPLPKELERPETQTIDASNVFHSTIYCEALYISASPGTHLEEWEASVLRRQAALRMPL